MGIKKTEMPTMSIDKYKDMKVMNKKFVSIKEGVELYSIGSQTLKSLSDEAGATYKINRKVLINSKRNVANSPLIQNLQNIPPRLKCKCFLCAFAAAFPTYYLGLGLVNNAFFHNHFPDFVSNDFFGFIGAHTPLQRSQNRTQ